MIVLRKTCEEDSLNIFNWRNDIETRKASFNTKKITIEDHQKWFANILNSDDKLLFIAMENDEPVGVVRADGLEDGFEISWHVAPDKRGLGLGKQMVKTLINKLGERCIARIKSNNLPSIKIAQFCGMILSSNENGVCTYIINQQEGYGTNE